MIKEGLATGELMEIQSSENESSSSDRGESSDSEPVLDETHFSLPDDNKFSQLLGVPTVTIESIYQAYRERDTNVL